MTEMVRRGALYHGPRTAVLFGDQSLTFDDVDRLSNRLANALIAIEGLAIGGRVGLLLNNSLLSMPIDFACAKARIVRVPLNSRLSANEQKQMLEGAGVTLLLHGADLVERARELAQLLPGLKIRSLGAGGDGDIAEIAQTQPDTLPDRTPEPDDVVIAIYTSGTTGKLKAVLHTQASWAAMSENVLSNMEIKPGDIMLHAASLIHASGCFVLPYWIRGGTAAVLPGFMPNAYIEAVERWKPTALNLVPTMIGMLLDHPGIAEVDMRSVTTMLYGASPMPRPTMERALKLWGPRFIQYYGQTEAPLFIAVLTKEDHVSPGADKRLAACGRPSIDCEIRLIDEDGRDVAPGDSGEIVLRAPFAMAGYYNAPELNAQTIMPGHWIRTRDVGRFDAEGYLYLVDRTSDMIVTGGYNVYPREVEDALAAHPAVREVVVVGIPDDKWGEAVAAFVAIRNGTSVEEAELIAFARDRLAGYKVPKSVRFIDDVPKSPVGKLLRRAVRDPFWAGRERRI
ncbi:class I adenylate-forming enzyme family protein [Bradyrhizobium prioriisuperbiae]|uniref:class I adenylate-forming enzyme family protein n=1 Tax=Bradyrhizobium prioriisuperbiae TaxID=2854389 RepID=UPI0028EDEDFB|nr:AMP-binding protein [Bradyrhizobium prioritasuperba]